VSEDREITCKDCGGNFIFTVGEQEFFQQKGFSEPVRCKPCRDARKAQKSDDRGEPSGARKRW
jgi:hypothetical protein